MPEPTGPPESTRVPASLPADSKASFNPQRTEQLHAGTIQQVAQSVVLTRWHVKQDAGAPAVPPDSKDPQPSAYVLRKVVGSGGFGEVWEALQTSLGRTVAVKRIRKERIEASRSPMMGTDPGVYLEFRQEAITAAQLDHPNIVPVYDIGSDEQGRPLLAMKLVKGRRWEDMLIEDFYALEGPDYIARHLEILIAASQAVAFAHARGIVHRDLKPSQIMVGEFGEVLLMDWGLALFFDVSLATSSTGADPEVLRSAPTIESGTNPCGTVAFMAPEQTRTDCSGIGPWTDVYLLGGCLYYLLTGYLPHQGTDSRACFLNAMHGVVAPPAEIAPDRYIPRDLADLAMRAMAADPDARVPGARAFIEGLRDYLSGASRRRESLKQTDAALSRLEAAPASYGEFADILGIVGQAASLWDANPNVPALRTKALEGFARAALLNKDLLLAQLQAEALEPGPTRADLLAEIASARRRIARRDAQRRLALVAAAVLLVAAGGATIVAGFSRQAAEQQRATADLLGRINALRSTETALAEDVAKRLTLPETIDAARAPDAPDEDWLRDISARRARALQERGALASDPRVGSRLDPEPLALRLADASAALATARSQRDFLAAHDRFALLAAADPRASEPLIGMGIAAARAEFATSASLHLQNAIDVAREQYGPESPQLARVYALAAEAIRKADAPTMGSIDVAGSQGFREYYERAIDITEREVIRAGTALTSQYTESGDTTRALELARNVLPMVERRYTRRSLEAARSLQQLGIAEFLRGDYVAAEAAQLEALGIRRELAGTSSTLAAQSLSGMTPLLSARGRLQQAAENEREAYEIFREVLGPDAPRTLYSLQSVVMANTNAGRLRDAEPVARELLARQLANWSPSHPEVARAKSSLGFILTNLGRPVDAYPLQKDAYDIARIAYGPVHRMVATYATELAFNLNQQSRFAEATPLYQEALDIRREVFGKAHASTLEAVNNLAYNLQAMGRSRDAEPLFREAYEGFLAIFGERHPSTVAAMSNYALIASGNGKVREAETYLRRVAELAPETIGPSSPDTFSAIEALGTNLAQQDRHGEAADVYRRVLAMRLEFLGEKVPITARTYGMLAELEELDGHPDQAWADFAKGLALLEANAPPQHPFTLNTRDAYAAGLLRAGRIPEARALARRNLRDAVNGQQPGHPAISRTTVTMLTALAASSDPGDWPSAAGFALAVREMLAMRKDFRSQDIAWTRGRDLAAIAEAETAILLRANPPQRNAAAATVLRAAALVELVGLPPHSRLRTHFLQPRAAELGITDRVADAQHRTAEALPTLWPDRSVPISAANLTAFLERIAPPPDLSALLPGIRQIDIKAYANDEAASTPAKP